MGDPSANTIHHRRNMLGEITNQARFVIIRCLGLCLLAASGLRGEAVNLRAYPEFLRVDPFGQIVQADRADNAIQAALHLGQRSVSLQGARGGYVSFHLFSQLSGVEGYMLQLSPTAGVSGI